MATTSMIERKATLRPPVYNRPRRRRADQIPLRWVASGLTSGKLHKDTEYKTKFHQMSLDRLPPIKQKDELAGYKSLDAFEKFSLYKSTYPPIASNRPNFPRPPNQFEPPGKDNSRKQTPMASMYKKEFAPFPSSLQRPQPTPNKTTWEPEPDPVSQTYPMVSLFHNDFKAFSGTDCKRRPIKNDDGGWQLPHYPLEGKSTSADAYSWKYMPMAQSYKPTTVYNPDESNKFTAMSEQKQSYIPYSQETYIESLTEGDNIDFKDGRTSRFIRPRPPPEGPSVDNLYGSGPIRNGNVTLEDISASNQSDLRKGHQNSAPLPPIAANSKSEKKNSDEKIRSSGNNEDGNVGNTSVKIEGVSSEQNNREVQKVIDSYRQSLYSTTYKSDY